MFFITAVILLLLLFNACFWLWLFSSKGNKPDRRQDSRDDEETSSFVIKPYVQLGSAPASDGTESLEILWHGPDKPEYWTVEVDDLKNDGGWFGWLMPRRVRKLTPTVTDVKIEGIPAQKQYRCVVSGLKPGWHFQYCVLKYGKCQHHAWALPRRGAGQPFTFIAVGDMGNGKEAQKKVAFQMSLVKPDFIAVTGDVVYMDGRISEYMERYFPVYHSKYNTPKDGARIIDSTLTVACAGNHDVGKPEMTKVPNFNEFADLMGYYLFWSMPLNGPALGVGARNTPCPIGDKAKIDALVKAAGERFPRMSNYSFDYADSHWLVLDANAYMDWTDEALRAWVEMDLATTTKKWKFVMFHQPSFTSNTKHQREQRMRLLAGIFEQHGVDIVFSGHAHCYERSYPIRFTHRRQLGGAAMHEEGFVAGDIACDKSFDGKANTRPNGVIYVVTGAGGAKLDSVHITGKPALWQPFTQVLIGDRRSFSIIDVEGNTLKMRQVDEDGHQIDELEITK